MEGPQMSQIICPKPQMQLRTIIIVITTLPEEIIFDILVRLPAHLLYNVMRYVCRQWRRIIEGPKFLSTHFQLASSTSTLLLHYRERSLYRILDVRECHAKLSGFEFEIASTHFIYACNGLMLFLNRDLQLHSTHYVGNAITRTLLALPKLILPIVHYGIAFEASSKVYKVIAAYRILHRPHEPINFDFGCAILTVGIDEEWRFLNWAHLTEEDMRLLGRSSPITSTEFIYWVPASHTYMLALDLKCESIKRISLPPFPYESLPNLHYLPKGNSISVWYPKSDYSMEVWLLKDFISEEWVQFLCISGEPIRNELSKVLSPNELASEAHFLYMIPKCWLGNGERILFDLGNDERFLFDDDLYTSHLFVYDLKTRDCCSFTVEYGEFDNSELQPFVNSLARVC